MDVIDFFSSEEQISEREPHLENQASKEAPSTDHSINQMKKFKNSKKIYEPIQDGNIIVRYEDDPVEYKKLRKKIQNRESSARIRGRKKGTMNSLQLQVQELKQSNSQLLLKNAELQTQNKALKNQVQFLRSVVRPNQSENIGQFLNIEEKSSPIQAQEYQSPFHDDSSINWVRSGYSNGSLSNWSTLFVLTIAVCVFVLPSDNGTSAIIAQQNDNTPVAQPLLINLSSLIWFLKISTKIMAGIGYLYFIFHFMYKKYLIKKRKKV